MLRGLVLGLAAANVAFFAWSHGWLGDLGGGLSPRGDREPQRIENQVNPFNLQVLALASTPATVTADTSAVMCLEAGPFSPSELGAAETAVRAALPEGSWATVRRDRPGVWIVYMGRFANRDQLARKQAELKRQNVAATEVDVNGPLAANLEPGLSFGRFERLEDAQDQLRKLEKQKVGTARIVTMSEPVAAATVRIARADSELQAAATKLRDTLKDKAFGICGRN